jgi:two-component system sensor histidine kinase DesK
MDGDLSSCVAALLRAANIDTTIDVDFPALHPPLESVVAWAVREGGTNVLRHARAATCRSSADETTAPSGWRSSTTAPTAPPTGPPATA